MLLTDFIAVLRTGKELANAETWKRAQVRGALLVALFSALAGIAKAFGYDLPFTPEEISSIAIAVGAIGGLLVGYGTVATTKRIGLQPKADSQLPEPADGSGQQPAAGESVHESAPRPGFPMPDMTDRG